MAVPCYSLDGTQYPSDGSTVYLPCNHTAVTNNAHTACCATGDLCLTNGLCRNTFDDTERRNTYWRNGCTDPTWKDPACPRFCEAFSSRGNRLILNCLRSQSWCCTPDNFVLTSNVMTTCCDDASANFTAPNPLVYATATLSAIPRSSTMFSLVSLSTSASTSPTAAPQSNTQGSGSSTGLKVGLGVGIPLGFVILALFGVFLCTWRRKRANADTSQPHYGWHEQEKPAVYARSELHDRPNPVEMPGEYAASPR